MIEKTVILSNFSTVKKFVELANSKDFSVELVSGRKRVNAKSYVGVFSLDLTKPAVCIAGTDEISFIKELKPFAYKD